MAKTYVVRLLRVPVTVDVEIEIELPDGASSFGAPEAAKNLIPSVLNGMKKTAVSNMHGDLTVLRVHASSFIGSVFMKEEQ